MPSFAKGVVFLAGTAIVSVVVMACAASLAMQREEISYFAVDLHSQLDADYSVDSAVGRVAPLAPAVIGAAAEDDAILVEDQPGSPNQQENGIGPTFAATPRFIATPSATPALTATAEPTQTSTPAPGRVEPSQTSGSPATPTSTPTLSPSMTPTTTPSPSPTKVPTATPTPTPNDIPVCELLPLCTPIPINTPSTAPTSTPTPAPTTTPICTLEICLP